MLHFISPFQVTCEAYSLNKSRLETEKGVFNVSSKRHHPTLATMGYFHPHKASPLRRHHHLISNLRRKLRTHFQLSPKRALGSVQNKYKLRRLFWTRNKKDGYSTIKRLLNAILNNSCSFPTQIKFIWTSPNLSLAHFSIISKSPSRGSWVQPPSSLFFY